jgi:hypothetical protein
MNNHKELFKLIQENPELPIVPMVNYEVCVSDDYNCWMGSWGKASIDEYWCSDGRIYFKDDDFEKLVQELIDNNYDNDWKGKTDEEMDKLTNDIVNGYEWIKCIVIYINTP